MSTAIGVKVGLVALGLWAVSKKKGGTKVTNPDQADPVIDSMPPEKQEQARDYVKMITWWETDPGMNHVAYGGFGPNVPPGWKIFPTKDALINGLLDGFFPNTDVQWNSTAKVVQLDSSPYWDYTLGDITYELLDHPLNTSALTRVDKYNVLNALTWPTFNPGTGTVNVPPTASLTAKQVQAINMTHYLIDLIAYETSLGGDQKFGDMGYVRFSEGWTNTGQPKCVMVGNSCLLNPYNGETVYRGTYRAMKNWLGYALYRHRDSEQFASLTWSEIDKLLDAYFKDSGQWDTLGGDGPHSTWVSSILGKIDWGKVLALIASGGGTIGAVLLAIPTMGLSVIVPAAPLIYAEIKAMS